jgi:hypothetical protein
MNAESHPQDPVVTAVLHDPAADAAHTEHEQPHDHATEVAHAWEHFHQNWKFFVCFFSVVLLTVVAWSINFGSSPLVLSVLGLHVNFGSWNLVVTLFFAAARSTLIAYFMATLFKSFTFVTKTFIFSAIFLAGMIFLSLWDSELGDPIKDRINVPPPPSHVP